MSCWAHGHVTLLQRGPTISGCPLEADSSICTCACVEHVSRTSNRTPVAETDQPPEARPLTGLAGPGRVISLGSLFCYNYTLHMYINRQTRTDLFPPQSQHGAPMNATGLPRAHCMEKRNILRPRADSQHPRVHMAVPTGCSWGKPQVTEPTCNELLLSPSE